MKVKLQIEKNLILGLFLKKVILKTNNIEKFVWFFKTVRLGYPFLQLEGELGDKFNFLFSDFKIGEKNETDVHIICNRKTYSQKMWSDFSHYYSGEEYEKETLEVEVEEIS